MIIANILYLDYKCYDFERYILFITAIYAFILIEK